MVLGDIILDKYYIGNVDRISPEAPIPIVNVHKVRNSLGGAANVCNNLSGLKTSSELIGITGIDDNYKIIETLLLQNAIKNSILISDKFQTITKIRIIGEHQQVVRVDFEKNPKINLKCKEKILNKIDSIISDVKIVIISDYGKGLIMPNICQYLINQCNINKKFIIIDPKGRNWNKYKNASIITPNFKEFAEVLNKHIKNENIFIEKYGNVVRKKFNLMHLLITRSEKGMSLINKDGVIHFPSKAKEVYDVSGAGDTVVATLASFLARGYSINTSIKIANEAAGIVVSKFSTVPINFDELSAYI